MFTHAINSTKTPAPCKRNKARRLSPANWICNGSNSIREMPGSQRSG